MVCLGNRDHSVISQIASKYCILDSFVDHDGYMTMMAIVISVVTDNYRNRKSAENGRVGNDG